MVVGMPQLLQCMGGAMPAVLPALQGKMGETRLQQQQAADVTCGVHNCVTATMTTAATAKCVPLSHLADGWTLCCWVLYLIVVGF